MPQIWLLPLLPITAWPRVVKAGPSVPTPMAGALYILPPERVHPVDVPFTVALKVFSKWGADAGDFVRGHANAKAIPGCVVAGLINDFPDLADGEA